MKWYLLASTLLLISCGSNRQEDIRPIVQNITESVYASGTLKSRNQYQVFSSVNGIAAQKWVTEGDTVKKGDVILTLVDEAAQLNSENAQLAATYSSLSFNAARLNELKVNIDLARAKMQNDSALYQRQKYLWEERIGTRNELEQRELAWKSSITLYQAALLQYQNLKKEIDFAARQSSKQLQISNSQKSDFTIRARQDGRVYNISIEPGEIVTPNTPIAIIGDVNEFILELLVDEYDISKIGAGQKVFVSMDTYKGMVFEAIVTRIQPIMNERTRSFIVEAAFTSRPQHLYPNLTVEANILLNWKENALTIPRAYLSDDSTVIMKNGESRKVVTGLKDYERVEILSGLDQTEQLRKPAE